MCALNFPVISAATTVGVRIFEWGIVLGKKNTSGHQYKSGDYCGLCDDLVDLVL